LITVGLAAQGIPTSTVVCWALFHSAQPAVLLAISTEDIQKRPESLRKRGVFLGALWGDQIAVGGRIILL